MVHAVFKRLLKERKRQLMTEPISQLEDKYRDEHPIL